jgi:hypothetical protein
MIFFARGLCMAAIGIALATVKVTVTSWQLWVIIVAVSIYGVLSYIAGANEKE